MTAEEITYDWLVENSVEHGYTDHIPHFKKLFSLMPNSTLFECGVGYSTKYFIDNCKSVKSIEFVNNGFGDEWMVKCMELYRNHKNWEGIISKATPEIYEASCYRASQHKDFSYQNDTYYKQLFHYLYQQAIKYDIAFVDCGIYLRGDLVNILLELNLPVVVAHDFGFDEQSINQYGWEVIRCVENYDRLVIGVTAFWIRKDFGSVFYLMEEYKENTGK